MDFLGIGPQEIILILIIAAVVVGPRRLPEVAVQLARVIRQLRGYATDVTSQMRAELDELTREYEQVRKDLQEFRESATKEVGSVMSEVDRAAREAPAIIESSAEEKPQKSLPPPRKKPAADDGS
jgi:sec-independent protein translocase protein TatB